jgi:hypothetical protein
MESDAGRKCRDERLRCSTLNWWSDGEHKTGGDSVLYTKLKVSLIKSHYNIFTQCIFLFCEQCACQSTSHSFESLATSCLSRPPIISRNLESSSIHHSLLGLVELVNPPTKVTFDANLETYDAGLLIRDAAHGQSFNSSCPIVSAGLVALRILARRNPWIQSNLDMLNLSTHRPSHFRRESPDV